MFLYVTYAVNPAEFYGFVSPEDSFCNLPNLIRSTCEELCTDPSQQGRLELSKLDPGVKYFMAKIGDQWFRCSDAAVNLQNSKTVMVTLEDAGKRRIPVSCKCPAVRMTKTISRFNAFRFSLSGAKPVCGNWTKEANSYFRSLVNNKVFTVPDYGSSQTITLSSLRGDILIADQLISANFAQSTCKQPTKVNLEGLPMESYIFLERTGGLNVSNEDDDVPISTTQILKGIANRSLKY